MKNANNFKIYPNPASETITIETPSDNQEYTIQLLNSLGQIVLERTTIQHSTFIVQHLSEGVYLVRIIPKNTEIGNVYHKKVIVSFGGETNR